MKLKKLFAGIVAVAMMATMAAPAFANREVDIEIPVHGKEFTIAKTYNVTGVGSNGTAPNEEFVLKQEKRVSATKSEVADFAGTDANEHYDLTIDNAKYEGSTKGLGFKVTLPDYNNHPGIYTYTLQEEDHGTAGVTYDPNKYTLTVYAMQAKDETDKTPTNELTYAVRLDVKDGTKLHKDYKITGLTNTYTSGSYKITKTVRGNMADRNKTFYFRATFDNIGNMAGNIQHNSENVTLNYTDDTHTSATVDFTLTHGNDYIFTNIPKGVMVSVNELTGENGTVVEKPDTGKAVNGTYEVIYDKKQSAEMEDGMITTVIINDSTENINTGVILDNAPYIALLTIVAAGAVVMIMKKRRNYED